MTESACKPRHAYKCVASIDNWMANLSAPMDFYIIIATIFAGFGFWSLIIYLFHVLWLNGENRRLILRRQGIEGPLPAFLLGNVPQMKQMLPAAPNQSPNMQKQEPLSSQHCLMNLFPYFKQWTKQYGQSFLFALGRSQFLYVADTYFVREINCFTSLDMGKPAYLQKDRGALLGKGLITTNGSVWYHQRKTIAPHLFVDKVKEMLQLMVESGGELVKSWGNIIEANGGIADIRVDDYVRSFTSYIISNVVFGDEWQKGMEIFPKSLALINAMSTPTILSGIPFYRYLPTKKNREIWRLEKEIHSTIMDIVKKHAESASKDLLQVIIEGSNGELGPSTADQFIVDNCKDICIPASEVTAVSAIWGLMLLASHPEWQTRIRNEVLGVCKDGILNFDMLHKMKALRMVVLEVLRLYPVTAFISRQALQNLKLGHVEIPKGVNIWLWLLELHFDPNLWGPDAEKFNPERFANGISRACKSSQAYIPFGVGARVCPGQSLAMTELQVLFAIILSNFSLTISPSYRHSPQYALLIEPEFGVNLLVQKI